MLMTSTAAVSIRNNTSPVNRTFLVRKDGQPFLFINGTAEKALDLVAGFRRRSDASWDLEPHNGY